MRAGIKRRFAVLTLTLAVISSAALAEVESTYELNTQVSISTDHFAELQGLSNRFVSQIDYTNSDFKLTGIVELEHELNNDMQAILSNNKNYSSLSRPHTMGNHSQITLRELYLSMPIYSHYLSIGKQQVVWGKADGVKVLDVINPQNFSEFILADFEQSRIPLWLVNLELTLADDILQILWIPDTSTHQLPTAQSAFNFTSPRFTPRVPQGIDVTLLANKAPKTRFKNSDVGLRWTSFINGWDIALNYLFHYEDLPIFAASIDPQKENSVIVAAHYFRSNLYGGSFSKPFGDFTFRSEIAYKTNQHHYQRDNTVFISDELNYVIGIDYFGLPDTLISSQLIQSSLLNTNDTDLFRPKSDTSFSLLLRRSFWQETLTTEILWQQNTDKNDGLVRPRINYIYSDNLTVSIGADMFYGEQTGLYGQFDKQDRLVFDTNWAF